MYRLEKPPPPPPPEPRPVLESRPCISCGYDLKGLDATGKCPECGREVKASLRGPLLRYASPEYLLKLHAGAIVLMWTVIGQPAVYYTGLATKFAMVASIGGAMHRELELGFLAAESAVSLGALAGWWLLSAPDPGIRSGDRGMRARRLVRLALLVSMVTTIVHFVATLALGGGALSQGVQTWNGGLLIGAWLLDFGADVLRYFAGLVYLAWLARRIPDRGMEGSAQRLMWLGPLLIVLLFCFLHIGWLVAAILMAAVVNTLRVHVKRFRTVSRPEAEAVWRA